MTFTTGKVEHAGDLAHRARGQVDTGAVVPGSRQGGTGAPPGHSGGSDGGHCPCPFTDGRAVDPCDSPA
eukprot:6956236-Lingulodinium_polyedra.AAC.1